MKMKSKLMAEFIGTFWLVLGGCGAAKLAATFNATDNINIGLVGVSLAFGLTVMTMAYAVGHISGGHFNPAVSVGLAVGGRFSWAHVAPYAIVQVLGAIAAAAVLLMIISGNGAEAGNLASNGYGAASPGGYDLVSVLLIEVVMTGAFLFIIMGATDKQALAGMAPIAIGLGLTLIHLISIPVSNTSVNPARSTGPALISMDVTAISQLWVFWIAPVIGAVLGALLYKATAFGFSTVKENYRSSAESDAALASNVQQRVKARASLNSNQREPVIQ